MSDKQTTIFTPSGTYVGDTSFGTPSLAYASDASMWGKISDARKPEVWVAGSPSWTWTAVDPIAMGQDTLVTQVSGKRYARAVQFDKITGRTFFLDSFRPASESSEMYGKITVHEPYGSTAEYKVYSGSSEVHLWYALDMKLDIGRRRLWILDSGNGRILRVNIDTNKVDRNYSIPGTPLAFALTLDQATGTAYVRTIGREEDEESVEGTSSSSSTAIDHNAQYETMYLIDSDDVITAFVETTGRTRYDDRFYSSPSKSFARSIMDGTIGIPFPTTNSICYDLARENLWWLSNAEDRTIFVANTVDMTMQSLYLPALYRAKTVTVNQDDGSAFATGSTALGTGMILVVDVSCTTYAWHEMVSVTSVNGIAIMDRDDDRTIPFVVDGIASIVTDLSSSSSSESGDVHHINNSLVGELGGNINISDPIVRVQIWAPSPDGMAGVRVWPLKGEKDGFAIIETSSAALLPRFSWSSKAFLGKPAIITATTMGDIVKLECNVTSKKLSATVGCEVPVGGAVLGLSSVNGDGNVYVSGGGALARINTWQEVGSVGLDESSESSESSQSISTQGVGMSWTPLVVSENINTMVAGLSVQYHENGGRVFALSGQTGMLIVAESISEWSGRTEYGPFQEPFKAVWSKHHSAALVAAKRTVNLVDVPSGKKTMLQGVESDEFTDISEMDGMVAITSKSDSGLGGLIKVLGDDLQHNEFLVQTIGEYPSRVCLISKGKAVVALETIVDRVGHTRFALANLSGGIVEGYTSLFEGSVVSLFRDDNFNLVFAAFGNGELMVVSDNNGSITTTVGVSVPNGIVAASGGMVSGVKGTEFSQTAARVIVGSRPGASDRWDSGEVNTTETTMVYGGGDNLAPGEMYWATILVQDKTLGWSPPFVKEFVAPMM